MTRVFVSGSRSVRLLPQAACDSLDRIMAQGFEILVGDCYGVDYLIQLYCKDYDRVKVFHIGKAPRNCLNDQWELVKVKGRKQTDKDDAMAAIADYGLAIWDGKSKGTARNIQAVPRTKVIEVKKELTDDYVMPALAGLTAS